MRNLLDIQVVIQRKFIFRRVRRCRNLPSMWCKPMVGSGRLLGSNSTSIDNVLGIMIQDFMGHCISTMLPKSYPVASPLFTFRRKMLVICCIEHRLVESEKKMMEMSGVIPVKANKGIFPSRVLQAMWLSR